MADIDVEEKNPVWPWIVAAVIIAIILCIIFIDTGPAEDDLVTEDEPIGLVVPNGENVNSNHLVIA